MLGKFCIPYSTLETHHRKRTHRRLHDQLPQQRGFGSLWRCGLVDHTCSKSCPLDPQGIHGLICCKQNSDGVYNSSLLMCPSPDNVHSSVSHVQQLFFVVTHHHNCSYIESVKIYLKQRRETDHLAGPRVGQSRACDD